ncbi:MAG: uridine kinase [Bacillota bacterium]|nr:uridine kinase [Bacillota bacterium]
MLFIGICGASGSGKSTLAEELLRAIGPDNTLINQDAYYYDHPNLNFEERAALNYDEPHIFDHDMLLRDIDQLLKGIPVQRKQYDFTQYRRAESNEMIMPGRVLILEGIHAFYDKRLLEKMFLKLFISVEPDICLLRRINRDMKERGRSIDSISEQYLKTVKPMYEKYIRNYIHEADIIISRGGKNARIVDVLAGYLKNTMENNLC